MAFDKFSWFLYVKTFNESGPWSYIWLLPCNDFCCLMAAIMQLNFLNLMCADPYSDMILVDGITLLCNDIPVVFLNAGQLLFLEDYKVFTTWNFVISCHQLFVPYGSSFRFSFFLNKSSISYLVSYNKFDLHNFNDIWVFVFWKVDPQDIVMVCIILWSYCYPRHA